jgi:hypothetical protein
MRRVGREKPMMTRREKSERGGINRYFFIWCFSGCRDESPESTVWVAGMNGEGRVKWCDDCIRRGIKLCWVIVIDLRYNK